MPKRTDPSVLMSNSCKSKPGRAVNNNSRMFSGCFYLLVILVNISVGKSLSTKLAFIGFIFTVYYFVCSHLIKSFEGLIANLAGVRAFFCRKWVGGHLSSCLYWARRWKAETFISSEMSAMKSTQLRLNQLERHLMLFTLYS